MEKVMSFTILRSFRHFRCTYSNITDAKIAHRVCFHCCSLHRQDDKHPDNVVSPQHTPKFIKKEELISKAMKSFLVKKQESDAFLQKNIDEYNLGKRHLANIMGVDEADLTKAEIRKAIAYLLPSGLHNPKARPLMEHPLDLLPDRRAANFDASGRPNHFLYYTLKPTYFQLMHDLAWKLERLRKAAEVEDLSKQEEYLKQNQIQQFDTIWLPLSQFEKQFKGENVDEHDYKRFLLLVERIIEQPLSFREKETIFKYRIPIQDKSVTDNAVEPSIDEEGRHFVTAKGERKTIKAEVTVRSKGSGLFTINGQDITYFEDLLHRQAVLWPLQLCEIMDKYDVQASVVGMGSSAQAGAVRLAISRALVSFVSREMSQRLRIAGLLTRDPRMRERKKPGQEKARKKFTWKKR